MAQQRVDYGELTTGYEFEPAQFRLDGASVSAYLDAVEGDRSIYEKDSIVPPMAVAALAMTAMSSGLSLPPGAVHVSQDLQFSSLASINEPLTSRARVSRKVERSKFRMLTININVFNQKQVPVLTGETSFILPLA